MDKHSWHKQMAAKMARNSIEHHHKLLDHIFIEGSKDIISDMLRGLERKFFLNRKEAYATIEAWKKHNGFVRIQH